MVDALAHGHHDRFAIAASIGDGTVPSIVGRCPACRSLHVDLRSLRDALRSTVAPRRTRDFQLDPAAAADLRPTRWRALTTWFGSPRDLVSRPLGGVFMGLGTAGLLLAGLTTGFVAPPSDHSSTGAAIGAAPRTPAIDRPDPAADGAGAGVRDAVPSPPDPLGDLSMAFLAAGGGIVILRRLSPGNRRARTVVQRTT